MLGTNLYDYFGGFTVCVIAITVVYALILPVLLLVPKRLIETAHGQTPEVAFTADDRQKICGPIYRPLGQQGLYNL